MFRPRVIPCLLLKEKELVKTVQFKKSRYIGDPLHAVKIFNEKHADELIFLDIAASRENRLIELDLVEKIGTEAMIPLTVGGGIRTVQDIKEIIQAGAEKVAINTHAVKNPFFIQKAAEVFGRSAIVIIMDVKKDVWGHYHIMINDGARRASLDPCEHARRMEAMGAGEIMVNSMDRDGTMLGYDVMLIRKIAKAVKIPVIACGGAGVLQDFSYAVTHGHASAVAAGSVFVYHGRPNTVHFNFPTCEELRQLFTMKDYASSH
jgi:cyclase